MSQRGITSSPGGGHQFALALVIIGLALGAASVLGGLAISDAKGGVPQDHRVAERVFSAVLPMVGSWIGAIIAFYYSRENFAAATQSVTKMAERLTPEEVLRAIPVEDAMIPRAAFLTDTRGEADIHLTELLERMSERRVRRIPILSEQGVVRYMIHRSMIDQHLTRMALRGARAAEFAALTLQDLLTADPGLRDLFVTSFATVARDATLAKAKQAMELTPDCQDVFVTETGRRDQPALGWITNGIMQEQAKV